MLTYLIGLLLSQGLTAVSHLSKPQLDKREAYYASCMESSERYLTAEYDQSSHAEIIEVVRKDCDQMMIFLEAINRWDLISDPTGDGCKDMIQLNLKGQPRSEIDVAKAKYCG